MGESCFGVRDGDVISRLPLHEKENIKEIVKFVKIKVIEQIREFKYVESMGSRWLNFLPPGLLAKVHCPSISLFQLWGLFNQSVLNIGTIASIHRFHLYKVSDF